MIRAASLLLISLGCAAGACAQSPSTSTADPEVAVAELSDSGVVVGAAVVAKRTIAIAVLSNEKVTLRLLHLDEQGVRQTSIVEGLPRFLTTMLGTASGLVIGAARDEQASTGRDVVLVAKGSAPWTQSEQVVNAGFAQYWELKGKNLTLAQTLRSPNAFAWDEFGSSLMFVDGMLFVGAPSGAQSGSVYRYRFLSQRWQFVGSATADQQGFGGSLAANPLMLAVGASRRGDSAVRVYHRGRTALNLAQTIGVTHPSTKSLPIIATNGAYLFALGPTLVVASEGPSQGDGGPSLPGAIDTFVLKRDRFEHQSGIVGVTDVPRLALTSTKHQQLIYSTEGRLTCRGPLPEVLALVPCAEPWVRKITGSVVWLGKAGGKVLVVTRSVDEASVAKLRVWWIDHAAED